jgi:GT2 family glycosyltransferase
MPSRPPLVTAVILNTNHKIDTLECLKSLRESSYANLSILLLDNASTDGSLEAVKLEYPEVSIVNLDQNQGYAGNNNVGIQLALEKKSDWVLILNEDTVMAPDCIEKLVQAGEMDPEVGIVGPLVFHFDEPEIIQSAGGCRDRLWRSWHLGQNETNLEPYREPRAVRWITGCSVMIRGAVLKQIGGFDERFYYYYEENEYCLRAEEAGWKILVIPAARLWHKGVQRNYSPRPSITYYSVRNHLLLLEKHRAPLAVKAAAWFDNLKMVASWSIRPKWRDKRGHRDAAVQAMTDFLLRSWGKRQE